ncbi:P-loop NTPase family protein [Gemmatimonas sp.]
MPLASSLAPAYLPVAPPDPPDPPVIAPHLRRVPEQIKTEIRQVVAGGRTASAPWSTGIPTLDAALGGGIPRGRITELSGPVAVGKTALLRQVVSQVLCSGAWVAWIDAGRTLAPAPWADLGERFVVIRLPEARRAAWTADLLLRSGVFGLVVLDGAPPLSRVHGVRLAQLARERDAACVVLEHVMPGAVRGQRLAGTVRVRVGLSTPPSMRAPSGRATASSPCSPPAAAPRVRITVEKGAAALITPQPIEVDRVIVLARRVCTHSEIPDRRGVANSARRPWTARGNGVDTSTDGQPVEHPVTWGGLGVGSHDLYGTDLPGHPARLAAGLDEPGDRLGGDRLGGDRLGGDRLQLDRELDRRTRDWTTYRGRRRAAESGFGRRGRRELARERTGALLTGGGGQSAPRDDRRPDRRPDQRPNRSERVRPAPAPTALG